jgi:hypothetical protein
MADVNETTVAMNDDMQSAFLQVRVRPKNLAVGPETIADRLEFSVEYPVIRDDGRAGDSRSSSWKHIDDGNISTFSVGDAANLRGLLLKLYNEGKIDLDL